MRRLALFDAFVCLLLIIYFLSRVVLSALKLSNQNIGTSMTTIIEDEILYPSITMCYRMQVEYNYTMDLNKAIKDTVPDISELIVHLKYTQLDKNRHVVVRDLSGPDLLASPTIHAYSVGRIHNIKKPGTILDCFTFDPPGPTLPGIHHGVSENLSRNFNITDSFAKDLHHVKCKPAHTSGNVLPQQGPDHFT